MISDWYESVNFLRIYILVILIPISEGFSWNAKLIKSHFLIISLLPRKLILGEIRNMTNSGKSIDSTRENKYPRKLVLLR